MGKTYSADTPFKSNSQVVRDRNAKREKLDFSEPIDSFDRDIRNANLRKPKSGIDLQREINRSKGWINK